MQRLEVSCAVRPIYGSTHIWVVRRQTVKSVFSGFRSGALEDSVLLGYYAPSLGHWTLTFRDNVMVSSSKENWGFSALEGEITTSSRNVRINYTVTRLYIPQECKHQHQVNH